MIPLELRVRLQHRIFTAMFAIDHSKGGILVLWDEHQPSESASAILNLALTALRSQFNLTDAHVGASRVDVRQMLGIADALPQGVIVVPTGNRPGYVNKIAAGYLGLPPGETEAGVLAAKLHETASRATNAEALRQHLGSFVQEHDPEGMCGLIWRFDSMPTALRVTLTPTHPEQASGWLWLLEDVSAEEARAEEHRRQQEWLLLAMSCAQAGTWEWRLAGKDNRWSEKLLRLYGLEDHEKLSGHGIWSAAITPEQLPKCQAIVTNAIHTHSGFSLEWCFTLADGQDRWLMSRGSPIVGINGQIKSYLGVVFDVTEHNKMQKALQDSEFRWKFAIEGSGDGLWDYNIEPRFLS